MHRTIQVSLAASDTDELCRALAPLKHVLSLSVSRGASIKPPGDVVTVHVLNRGADDVLKRVRVATDGRVFSVATSELTSIIDPHQAEAIENDVDEAIWEEMETGLRHQGRVTPNYIALMALGGAIAAVGLVSDPAPQAIAFIAASVISPGFEPLAKIPLGLVLGRWNVAGRGLLSAAVGYAVLILAAALTMYVLLATGTVTLSEFTGNPEIENISHPKLKEVLVPACGALAGMVMIAAYRRSVIAGPLIALVIIPAAAMMGASLAARESILIVEALERLGLDVLMILVAGGVVFFIKQLLVHRRKPVM